MIYNYDIGEWIKEYPRQNSSYSFLCPNCGCKSYFIGKGEKKIGRYCTWCGKENKKKEEPDEITGN